MATKPSSQSKARATSGALEIAKAKISRILKQKGKVGTDAGVGKDARFKNAVKEKKTLERKQNRERFKVK